MTEWKKCKIADLGRVVTGKTPSTKEKSYWGGDVPFITPKDLQAQKHILSTERNISELSKQVIRNSVLPAGSICVSCIGNIGYTGVTVTESVTNQQINSIIPFCREERDFIYYTIRNLWGFFKHYEGQSTALSILNKTQFEKIEITIPSDQTMRVKIGTVLRSIDEKIEENTAINHNLQQQAQALYKAQFPYSVEDELPPGWKLGKVRDIIELHDSKRIPLSSRERDKMTERRYPYYGATSVMDYVSDYIFDGCYLLLAEDGTVIDSNGHPVLQYVWGKFWVNNHTHIITGKNGFNVESLLLYFSQLSVQSIVTGAVQPKISQANLCSVPVIIPPREVVEEFNSTISSFFTMIRGLSDENNRLAQLRDSLLPKLMRGEIDVSEVEV